MKKIALLIAVALISLSFTTNSLISISETVQSEVPEDRDCDAIAHIKYDDALEAGLDYSTAADIWVLWLNVCVSDGGSSVLQVEL